MSSAFYIVLAKEFPDFDPFVDGTALSKTEKKLDKLAKKLKVTPLLDFFYPDYEDMIVFLDNEGLQLGQETPFDVPWHNPEKGLETINALLNFLQNNPKHLKNSPEVIENLLEFQQVLTEAIARNVKWLLAIDY